MATATSAITIISFAVMVMGMGIGLSTTVLTAQVMDQALNKVKVDPNPNSLGVIEEKLFVIGAGSLAIFAQTVLLLTLDSAHSLQLKFSLV